jgi:hypothetical protein
VTPPDDLESTLKRIPEINRRSYRKKAEKLLESLGILDNHTREVLKEIIEVRDKITHSGRFVDPEDKKKAANMYSLFLKILVPDDNTFYQQYGGPTKIIE